MKIVPIEHGYTPCKLIKDLVLESIDRLEKALTTKELSGFLRRQGLHDRLTYNYDRLCELWETLWEIDHKERMGEIFENMKKDKENDDKNNDENFDDDNSEDNKCA